MAQLHLIQMNNEELNHLLRSATPPERPAEYWEEFPRQIVRDLRLAPAMSRASRPVVPRFAWALAIALGCVLGGYFIGQRAGRTDATAQADLLLQNEKFLQELTSFFPDRLRAVVKDESGVQLVLSDQPDVPASTPVWVKISHGKSCTTLVTFSGQELQIAGHDLTVLTDAENRVILTGDRFAWTSSGDGNAPSDLKIQARTLEIALK